jgi:hypothetical protein
VLYNASVYKDDKGNVIGVLQQRDVTSQNRQWYARSLVKRA